MKKQEDVVRCYEKLTGKDTTVAHWEIAELLKSNSINNIRKVVNLLEIRRFTTFRLCIILQ